MKAMLTSTPPAGLREQHVPLTTGLAAVAEARTQVRAIVGAWQVPVDAYVAMSTTRRAPCPRRLTLPRTPRPDGA